NELLPVYMGAPAQLANPPSSLPGMVCLVIMVLMLFHAHCLRDRLDGRRERTIVFLATRRSQGIAPGTLLAISFGALATTLNSCKTRLEFLSYDATGPDS